MYPARPGAQPTTTQRARAGGVQSSTGPRPARAGRRARGRPDDRRDRHRHRHPAAHHAPPAAHPRRAWLHAAGPRGATRSGSGCPARRELASMVDADGAAAPRPAGRRARRDRQPRLLVGDHVEYIAQARPALDAHVHRGRPPRRRPLHRRRQGDARHLPRRRGRALSPRRPPPHQHTITDPDPAGPAAGAATGHALDEGEQEVGVRCVAVAARPTCPGQSVSASGTPYDRRPHRPRGAAPAGVGDEAWVRSCPEPSARVRQAEASDSIASTSLRTSSASARVSAPAPGRRSARRRAPGRPP